MLLKINIQVKTFLEYLYLVRDLYFTCVPKKKDISTNMIPRLKMSAFEEIPNCCKCSGAEYGREPGNTEKS